MRERFGAVYLSSHVGAAREYFYHTFPCRVRLLERSSRIVVSGCRKDVSRFSMLKLPLRV